MTSCHQKCIYTLFCSNMISTSLDLKLCRYFIISISFFDYLRINNNKRNIWLQGMHFVSSVLLMRMNMPPEYRMIITQVLGDLQFSFYHRWFDVIFLVSALSSIVFLYLAHTQAPPDKT